MAPRTIAHEPQVTAPVAKAKAIPPSARNVVVACKIPNGIWLQLQKSEERPVETRDGTKMLNFWVKGGKRYYINGPAYPVGQLPKGFPRPPLIEGGYAITRGIPADVWEQWWEQNKLADYCVAPDGAEHGMIFAYPDLDSVVDAAREQESLMSGLEPLSTETDSRGKLIDPRMPQPITQQLLKTGTYNPDE